jgi:hypothetical protein
MGRRRWDNAVDCPYIQNKHVFTYIFDDDDDDDDDDNDNDF